MATACEKEGLNHMKHTIGFIGAGNMANSLIGGLIANKTDPQKIWASDPGIQKLHQLQTDFGIHTSEDNKKVASSAQILILAVKPQQIKQVASELSSIIKKNNLLVISIAAGIRTADLEKWLGNNVAIVRCMPNVPALVGCGATGLFATQEVNSEQRDLAEAILRAVGTTVWIAEEDKLDIVTALSGCGPAYFFLIMEAIEKAGKQLGLESDVAHLLTLETALGAARMALATSEELAELRQRVTSPGGATEQALKILEAGEIRNIFADAIRKATEHSAFMAKQFAQ